MKKIDETFEIWKSLQPLSDRMKALLSRKFSIEYNYNSNHIEGSTLTYGQTELLLLFGKVTGSGNVRYFSDMKASQVGVEMAIEAALDKTMPLTQNFIRQLHKVLLRDDYKEYRTIPGGATTSYTVHAGQYKKRPNSVITRYGDRFEYASPNETPSLMADLVDWYNSAEQEGKLSPVELAALFHYRYIRIHPFEDGNGRIARLMVNYILARHGWPMIVVRSRNKAEYLDALHRTDMVIGSIPSEGAAAGLDQIKIFLQYFTNVVNSEILYDIDLVENDGSDMWWFDGERLKFRTPTSGRILSLMKSNPYITYKQMSAELGVNISALQKQINKMKERGYLERQDGSWYVFAITTKR